MRTDDPLRDYDHYEAMQYEAERKQPHCCICGNAIWDDYLYDIAGDLYCEDCMNDRYRHSTEDYERD